MNDFKISLFEKEYGFKFPKYGTLSEGECSQIKIEIVEKYGIDPTNIFVELTSKLSYHKDIDGSDDINLIKTLDDLGITSADTVYVNWANFDNIDAFNVADLNKYFTDIWFPVADYIEIFDRDLNWILAIRHNGEVSFIKY